MNALEVIKKYNLDKERWTHKGIHAVLRIIGTKIATQVFKEGDEVEVDADRGMVRKI